MNIVRAELVPRLETAVGNWVSDTFDEDDPVERALFDYSSAFKSEGDNETAAAFDNALDIYSQLQPSPTRSQYEWGTSTPRKPSNLTPSPEPDRSIFDDIDH